MPYCRRSWILPCQLLFAFVVFAGAITPAIAGDDQPEVEISDVMVAMSDGVELATSLYRPKERGPFR